ncbi:MAG: hypothetical protein A2171_01350 [Candidatus Levybacteria bacterium RBG_13_35_9]|nr:MAG: hypothetical protein A2171_01350 [Candidatus Levybacteria bacterium RBG_13_35_9]
MDDVRNEQPTTAEPPNPSQRPLEKEITLKNGENIILPSIQIDRMRLFHGSPISGIKEFKVSEETTIGNGFYTTSSRDAAVGYATVRSNAPEQKFVYEVEINNMNILDLSTDEALNQFTKLWREKLSELRAKTITSQTDNPTNEDLRKINIFNYR